LTFVATKKSRRPDGVCRYARFWLHVAMSAIRAIAP
jgi:hypothetical protein